MTVSLYTLRISRPQRDAGHDEPTEELEGREAIIPVYDRVGMAHPRVVRAKRRDGLAPWFKRLHG